MKARPTRIARILATLMLGGGLVVATAPAFSQTGEPGARGEQRRMDPEKMKEKVRARTERLAARLEIKAPQQDAWNAYARVRESMFTPPANRPARDADAATVTRFRAEMAQQRAQKMAGLAEATANLQNVLEPAQRKILDEISRRGGRHGMHGRQHGHGMGGGPGAQDGEPRRWQGPRSEAAPDTGDSANG